MSKQRRVRTGFLFQILKFQGLNCKKTKNKQPTIIKQRENKMAPSQEN